MIAFNTSYIRFHKLTVNFSVGLTLTSAYQVQEQEIKFSLFNKNVYNSSLTADSVCDVDPNEDIKVLVHGKGNSALPSWIPEMTENFLRLGNHNVIQVDWSAVSGLGDDLPIYKASDVGE